MKREILFKGKRVDNGQWVEGLPIYLTEYAKDFNEIDGIQCNKTRDNFDIHPETVCQFTGLTDKNGKKIFDGDKLECSDIYNDEPYTTTVRFEDGGFLVDAKGCDYNITCIGFLDDEIELEIIGNIHD